MDEASLRQFVCKYSGHRWEEFFETLFGYEAKLAAREWSWREMSRTREMFAAWRDPIIARIDARNQARKAKRERKLLQAVEVKALQAGGMNAAEAEAKAGQIAEVMVHQAAEGSTAANMKQMLETARQPEKLFTLKPRRRTGPGVVGRFFDELIGPRTRFLVGAVLLMGFTVWLFENDLLALDQLLKQLSALSRFSATPAKALTPLTLPAIPLEVTNLFGTVYAGAAGLILVVSGLFVSRRMTFAVVPGAAAIFFAPWIAERYAVSALAVFFGGLVLAALGFFFLWKVYYRGPRAYEDE